MEFEKKLVEVVQATTKMFSEVLEQLSRLTDLVDGLTHTVINLQTDVEKLYENQKGDV